MPDSSHNAPSRNSPDTHQRGHDKVSRIPVKVQPTVEMPRKPKWIRAKVPTGPGVKRIKQILRERKLSSVCEEALCPNLGECFSHGTATFMIMGDICTRRCPFCDVAHGRPGALDPDEPRRVAEAVQELALKFAGEVCSADQITALDSSGQVGWYTSVAIGAGRQNGSTRKSSCSAPIRRTPVSNRSSSSMRSKA